MGKIMVLFRTGILSLAAWVLCVLFTLPTVHAGPTFMYSPDLASQGYSVTGGEVSSTRYGKGWKALTTQAEEVESRVQHAIDYRNIPVNVDAGTIDFLVEREEPVGDPTRWEALVAMADPNLEGAYPFELVVYVEWNSKLDGNPALHVDATGQTAGKTEKVWGRIIPFSVPVDPGEQVHIRISWGPDGPASNRIVFNGIEARHYYLPDGVTESPRDGSLAAFLPDLVHLRIGNSLQSPLYGTILYGTVLYDEVLAPDLPYGYGLPEISGVSHNGFEVAGYSGKLVAGDAITVTMVAEPGGTAAFDLGPIVAHPMTESATDPGTYTGIHIIKYGEEVEDGQVIGHFTSAAGLAARSVAAERTVTLDPRIYLLVETDGDLLPADEVSTAGITVRAADANGKPVRDHELRLTMSTTDEYTGTVGGGTFADNVGGQLEVRWGGVTDSFGEVTAQYVSGFAAKTILVSAKDMVTGDIGVGHVRSFIEGTVDIVVRSAAARALAVAGTLEVKLSRDWLTADGMSRSRITAVAKDAAGNPVQGHSIAFNLLGDNGNIRVVQSRTDNRGRATADYIAGTRIGLVQIQIRDLTAGTSALVSIELRPDAPAEIALSADPPELFTDDARGSLITARVTDVNGNPNADTDVLFEMIAGSGTLSADRSVTDARDGVADVTFYPGSDPGVNTIKATVISRVPLPEELDTAGGAIFMHGLADEPVRLEVVRWLVEAGSEVVKGQELVVLEDRRGTVYTLNAPREGTLSVFTAEEGDRVEYGQTLGYVISLPE